MDRPAARCETGRPVMPRPHRITVVFGTRPEAIKLAPVIHRLREATWADVRVLSTAQHRTLTDRMVAWFGIAPDHDLDLMRAGQTVPDLLARTIAAVHDHLRAERPACVVAQGDTTTVLATAFASHYLRIPFAHVEAGLRTGDVREPYPEELNRFHTARLARLHFAPTERARANLRDAGVPDARIFVTGNTAVDALQWTLARTSAQPWPVPEGRRLLLVTAHRRESFGAPLRQLCSALRRLAARGDVAILFPVHPNPNVQDLVHAELGDQPAIALLEPLDYPDMVRAMRACTLVLTDSGGIQEEAPTLGKPVLVLRPATERPEAVEAGVARIVGRDPEHIVAAANELLDDPVAYAAMARPTAPFGDGHAAERITAHLERFVHGHAAD